MAEAGMSVLSVLSVLWLALGVWLMMKRMWAMGAALLLLGANGVGTHILGVAYPGWWDASFMVALAALITAHFLLGMFNRRRDKAG